jgi:predicted transporter
MGDRDIPLEVQQNLRRWAWIGNSLRIVHVVLGVVATGAGLYVATFTERDPTYTKLGTFIGVLPCPLDCF